MPSLRALFALASVLLLSLVLAQTAAAAEPPRVLAVEFSNDINPVTEDYLTGAIERANDEDYDAVVIPGGLAPDYLRIDPTCLRFVADMYRSGRLVAAICHGPQVLISTDANEGTDLVRGRSADEAHQELRVWIRELALQDMLLAGMEAYLVPAGSGRPCGAGRTCATCDVEYRLSLNDARVVDERAS